MSIDETCELISNALAAAQEAMEKALEAQKEAQLRIHFLQAENAELRMALMAERAERIMAS